MAKISNLAINLQTDSSNTYYATWKFNEKSKATSPSGSIKVGSLVSVKSGAKWYNGVSISSWVFSDQFYVASLSGDRAVLGKNKSGTNNVQSAINTKYLTVVSGAKASGDSTVADNTLDHYAIKWYYDTGDDVWFVGQSSDETVKQSTYSPPENAINIKVKVKPVSKKYKKNGKDTSYWSGEWVSKTHKLSLDPPDDPSSAPEVSIEKFKMTCTIVDITDPKADKIQFQVYKGNNVFKTGTVSVKTQRAIFTCTVSSGGKYRVRYRVINVYKKTELKSNWSSFSSEYETIPHAITGLTAERRNATSVQLNWHAVEDADSYDIQYVTSKKYFDSSSQVGSMSTTTSRAFVDGLESGNEWFFRVRAINAQGESGWSKIVNVTVGSEPEVPTTWTLSPTAIVGDDVVIYWTHNTEDGSRMRQAELKLTVNGETLTVDILVSQDTIDEAIKEGEPEKIYSHTIDTNTDQYSEGAKIKWQVRTKGILNDWSDWSTEKEIELFATPSLSLNVSNLVAGTTNDYLDSYPLDIWASAEPTTQKPLSYHVTISAVGSYETTEVDGSTRWVQNGDEIYSEVFNYTKSTFSLKLDAGDVLFEDDRRYKLKVVVAMDSGLTAEDQFIFAVHFKDYSGVADASIVIDKDTLSAYISPVYYEETEDERVLMENVTLSVYRREYNGKLTLIDGGSINDGNVTVVDPHPSLDYARYRIVARHEDTGQIEFEDIPGEFIGEPSIIIQWDESWSSFDYIEDVGTETPPWTGSMLRLPYNVDVGESYSPDISLIEYIGRKHPVSYYGTQRGETANWSTEIDKTDKETLYLLRRLAAWSGDVYVREPSGIGYWAQITVSMNINHLAVTVPVTFNITRVEGEEA